MRTDKQIFKVVLYVTAKQKIAAKMTEFEGYLPDNYTGDIVVKVLLFLDNLPELNIKFSIDFQRKKDH